MSGTEHRNPRGLPVVVIVGATSKWQADGPNTAFAHGGRVSDEDLPLGARWGLGGALAQKFAGEGHFVVLTTRTLGNATGLIDAIRREGGECMGVELDVSSEEAIGSAFSAIR